MEGRDVLAVLPAAVGPVDLLDVPAVGLVALGDVLVERDVGVVLDRDLVVVVDQDQVAELLGAGDRGGLAADALLEVAVAGHGVDEVVERRVAEGGVGVQQAVLAAGGHRHADRVADALAERTGGGLDAGRVAVLRVAGRLAAPGAQGLEVLELETPAAEVELDVEGDARVTAGEHEPVPAGPVRIGRVVTHHLLEEQVRRRGQAHRRARDGRCRPSAPRPWPAPGRCRRPGRRSRSSPASPRGSFQRLPQVIRVRRTWCSTRSGRSEPTHASGLDSTPPPPRRDAHHGVDLKEPCDPRRAACRGCCRVRPDRGAAGAPGATSWRRTSVSPSRGSSSCCC